MKLTFPLMDRPPMPKEGSEHREHAPLSPDGATQDPVAMNKSIRVSGFKNIADGELPAMNQDGIKSHWFTILKLMSRINLALKEKLGLKTQAVVNADRAAGYGRRRSTTIRRRRISI